MVDLHAHLPQIPNAGLGAGLDLLTWLERYIFPLERDFDEAAAERSRPLAWRSFARAGTTTALVYGAVYEASLDASFRAAEAHGIRAIIGKVMMDRGTYDPTIEPADDPRADRCASRRTSSRAGTGATTAGCSTRSRRGSRSRARPTCCASRRRWPRSTGAYWQTHVSEDRGEIAEVARLFPEALDYVDVYDRAGGLGERRRCWPTPSTCPIASSRGSWRPATHVAHCPASNLFLASGVMPLGRYLEAGLSVGLGSDVAGGPDLSIFTAMRVSFYAQNALRVAGSAGAPAPTPLDWLRMGVARWRAGARARSTRSARSRPARRPT